MTSPFQLLFRCQQHWIGSTPMESMLDSALASTAMVNGSPIDFGEYCAVIVPLFVFMDFCAKIDSNNCGWRTLTVGVWWYDSVTQFWNLSSAYRFCPRKHRLDHMGLLRYTIEKETKPCRSATTLSFICLVELILCVCLYQRLYYASVSHPNMINGWLSEWERLRPQLFA